MEWFESAVLRRAQGLFSGRRCWQPADRSIGGAGEGLGVHGAAGGGPFVVGLEHAGADEAGDGCIVRDHADDIGAALDLAVDAIEGVCGRCSRGKSM